MGKSVAFKCTYNDGDEGTFVGFGGTCSKDNIERNVTNLRVWCSNELCECRQFYEGGMKGKKPESPCYESRLFREWRFGAGRFHTGVRAGEPIHMRQVEEGKFAILTTRFPNSLENERRIIGLFQIGEILEDPETVLVATPTARIRLRMEEAKELHYWAYCRTASKKPDWRTGLFRYLEDGQVHRILVDVAATVRDENTRAVINNLIAQTYGKTSAPPASGYLAHKSKG